VGAGWVVGGGGTSDPRRSQVTIHWRAVCRAESEEHCDSGGHAHAGGVSILAEAIKCRPFTSIKLAIRALRRYDNEPASGDRLKKVFISYSLKPCATKCAAPGGATCLDEAIGTAECKRSKTETQFLKKLVDRLKSKFDVLWDREVLFAGENWRDKLYPCFGESHAAIILLTEGAFTSHYVPLESMVLMWRRVLEPTMLLIPVYFGAVNEMRLKDAGSAFYGIGLEDIEAIKHTGDDDATIEEIDTGLDAIADPVPLESIALLQRLTGLIDGAYEGAMEAAAAELETRLEARGSAAKPVQLALSILRRRLGASLTALNKLVTKEKRRPVLDLLAPTWVDVSAARPVWGYRALAPNKPVLVINGKQRKTAEHYVQRAWAHTWDQDLFILPVTAVSNGRDSSSLREAFLYTYWQRMMDPELSTDEWNDEARQRVQSVIHANGKAGLPLHVIVQSAEGLDPEDVLQLQVDFPEITVIYLNAAPPQAVQGFFELKPELGLTAELTAMKEYNQAYVVLGR
jgi:hypothetical protein